MYEVDCAMIIVKEGDVDIGTSTITGRGESARLIYRWQPLC